MSDPGNISGPDMICATRVLKTGGVRIGKIAGSITLPRTVRLVSAVSAGVGALIFLCIAAIIGGGLMGMFYGSAIGAAIGWGVTTFSPLRGESMATWLWLQLQAARSRRRIDGKPVILAVGTAAATRLPEGKVQLHRSAIRVAPGSCDERGVLRSNANQNLVPTEAP